MAGTIEEPQAMLVFQNRELTEIGGIDSDADLSRTVKGAYHPHDDIAMLFSKPESIDSVVSAHLGNYLPDSLEERCGLDIADGAADLGNNDIGVGLLDSVLLG